MNHTQTKKTSKLSQSLRFDTHKAVKNIAAKGIKTEAAEAIVDTMKYIATANYEDLATKQELQDVKQELMQKISESNQQMYKFYQELKQEIKNSSYEQKLYANKMVAAIIIGAPTFYTGLEFIIKILEK